MSPPSSFSEVTAEQSPILKFQEFDNSIPKPWKLYPMERYQELTTIHGKEQIKVIHMVRHAEGTHNVEQHYKEHSNIDARLTPKGREQCSDLAEKVQETMPHLNVHSDKEYENDIAVIVSPMTRCVQTALYSFPWLAKTSTIPFVAHETLRETVNYSCDRRRPIREISSEFQRVDFSFCDEDLDFIWNEYRQRLSENWEKHMESAELNVVASRAYEGFSFLQERPEHHLIVCSHSGKRRQILYLTFGKY